MFDISHKLFTQILDKESRIENGNELKRKLEFIRNKLSDEDTISVIKADSSIQDIFREINDKYSYIINDIE